MQLQLSRWLAPLFAGWLLLGIPGQAGAASTTQAIPLAYGWNAVWLEVAPVDTNGNALTAERVFTSPDFTVDRIATQTRQAGTAEFSTDPNQLFNQPGWLVWSANAPSGETASILAEGHRAYLVHVSRNDGTLNDGPPAGTLAVTGRASFWLPEWNPGSYNLAGFSVAGSPTFGALLGATGFTDATTATGSPIQRLNPATGAWEGIGGGDVVEAGRAYWIQVPFSLASRSYAGPVAVLFPGAVGGSLAFGNAPASIETSLNTGNGSTQSLRLSPAELTFTSLEPTGRPPHAVTLTLLQPAPGAPGSLDLRLFPLQRAPEQLAWQIPGNAAVGANWAVGTLGPQQSKTTTLGLDRNWTAGGNFRENLYRIDIALPNGSTYFHLPVSARNTDLAPPVTGPSVPRDPGLAGLWLGTISLASVTSLTESTQPVRPAATVAPVRVLVHVGTNGQASLLAQVTRMQTKSAAAVVPRQEVLIVDDTQIPYYEGIEERDGRKIGIRYDTAFFDMPRRTGTNAQPASFLLRVAASTGRPDIASVTDADVAAYLSGQDTRPPDLQEAYWPAWPLEGSFLPGQSIGTSTNQPLRLDSFHRSNPFRHAYHPQHGAGYLIERSLLVALDADYRPGSGQLTGTYQETTSGLATAPLVSRGRITLQRVSTATVVH